MSKAFDNSQIIKGAPAPIVDGAGSGLDADFVKNLPDDFTHSFTKNGYQKLPSGLIIQWGYTTVIDVTFPIAFPNAILNTTASKSVLENTGVNNTGEIAITYVTLTGMCVVAYHSRQGSDVTNQGISWMVIGY